MGRNQLNGKSNLGKYAYVGFATKKMVITILQDFIFPMITLCLLIVTYLIEYLDKVNNPILNTLLAMLCLVIIVFYVARIRTIWIDGTQKRKDDE